MNQHLADLDGVCLDVPRHPVVQEDVKGEPFLLRPEVEGIGKVVDEAPEVDRPLLEGDRTGLDLSEVEDLIDQLQEVPRRGGQDAHQLLLLRRELGSLQEARHADDAGERVADLVAGSQPKP